MQSRQHQPTLRAGFEAAPQNVLDARRARAAYVAASLGALFSAGWSFLRASAMPVMQQRAPARLRRAA
jgi:hypothetical protein